MMDFHVGQQVVCVDDGVNSFDPMQWMEGGLDGLTRGMVYTVRWIGVWSNPYGELIGVRLEEIIRPRPSGYPNEAPFAAARFRPLRKTNISIFEAMLINAPKEELVP